MLIFAQVHLAGLLSEQRLLRAYKYIRGQSDVWSRCPCVCENRGGDDSVSQNTHTHTHSPTPPPVYSLCLNPLHLVLFAFFSAAFWPGAALWSRGHGQDSWGQQEPWPEQTPPPPLPPASSIPWPLHRLWTCYRPCDPKCYNSHTKKKISNDCQMNVGNNTASSILCSCSMGKRVKVNIFVNSFRDKLNSYISYISSKHFWKRPLSLICIFLFHMSKEDNKDVQKHIPSRKHSQFQFHLQSVVQVQPKDRNRHFRDV